MYVEIMLAMFAQSAFWLATELSGSTVELASALLTPDVLPSQEIACCMIMPSTKLLRSLPHVTYGRKPSRLRNPRVLPIAGSAAAEIPTPPVVEMKDVMDASLGAIDRTVYEFLKAHESAQWHLTSFSVRCDAL
eukprot:jgi/Ulvmu1/4902/UM020_0188.1